MMRIRVLDIGHLRRQKRNKSLRLTQLLGVLLLSGCALQPGIESAVSVEIGPTFLSGDLAGGALLLSEAFDDRWVVHLGYISEQKVNTCGRPDCHFDIRENLYFGGQRTTELWNRLDLGIGVDYFQNTNRALGCRFTVGLLLGVRFTDRFSVRARHNSNAGSCSPNLGQDLVSVAWNF